jgi:hypothetical protein
MPKFESPIGSKKISGQPMREFDVPDEGDDQQYEEMTPVMRRRGPSTHGPQPPVDIEAALAFQNRIQSESAQDVSDMERQIREARIAKRTGKERLNDGARRRIEMLVGITRHTRTATIEDNVYVLQTLRSKEMRDAITAAAEFDGTVQSPFEIRRQLVARSLVQVAGLPVEQFVGSNLLEDRLVLIDDMDDAMLNRLYDEYLIMIKEIRERYAIKTPEDAKGVVEDLKK